MNIKTVKAGIVQKSPVFLNLEKSVELCCSIIAECAKNEAQIIAFSETWLTGYPIWLDLAPKAAAWRNDQAITLYRHLSDNALKVPGVEFNTILEKCYQTESIVILSAHEKFKSTLYNTMIYINGSLKEYSLHRKLVPTYTERLVWGRGDGSMLKGIETQYGTIGGLICWEHWMPLARAAMHNQNESIHIAQWPGAHDIHQLASRNYAFEGQCYVLAAGQTLTKDKIIEEYKSKYGNDDIGLEMLMSCPPDKNGLFTIGGSAFIAPDSQYIQGPVYYTDEILYAELDLSILNDGNLFLDSDGHYSRPDVFTLKINSEKQENVQWE